MICPGEKSGDKMREYATREEAKCSSFQEEERTRYGEWICFQDSNKLSPNSERPPTAVVVGASGFVRKTGWRTPGFLARPARGNQPYYITSWCRISTAVGASC